MRQASTQGAGTKGAPTTQTEMFALQQQRQELKDQLASLNKRRNQLQEQRSGLSADAGRDHDLRIREIDQRAADIDRQLMRLDVAIANGLGKPLVDDRVALKPGVDYVGVPTVPPAPPVIPGVSQADRIQLLGVGAVVVIAVFVAWHGLRRIFTKSNANSLEGQSRRLGELQNSIDTIALEVERMSESQRFVAKVLSEKFPALGVGDAQPISAKAKDAAKA